MKTVMNHPTINYYNNIINFEYLDTNLNIANGKPITDGYGANEDQAYG